MADPPVLIRGDITRAESVDDGREGGRQEFVVELAGLKPVGFP